MKNPQIFYSYYTFWRNRQWHYEISTNFNFELYLKYLNALYERDNKI